MDAFAELRIVDYGDAPVLPADPARSAAAIEQTVGEVLDAGLIPIVLGGDHSIAEPDIAACAARHGPVGLVHFDTHTDTGTEVFGVEVSHGTPMYRLVRSGAVDPARYVQIGLRGYWPGEREFAWQAEQGITSIFMHEVRDEGIDAVVERAVGIVGAGPVFLSVDVDVLDPAFAPGTGTPEPGGMTSVDLLKAVRVVAERLDLVGADVVEVIPTAVGSADITALVAERIVREILTGIALRRAAASVMQCAPPPRRARLVAGTPTTSRSGKTDSHLGQPFPVGGQAGERDDHAAVAEVEVEVRQREPPSGPLAVGQDVELDHLQRRPRLERLERRGSPPAGRGSDRRGPGPSGRGRARARRTPPRCRRGRRCDPRAGRARARSCARCRGTRGTRPRTAARDTPGFRRSCRIVGSAAISVPSPSVRDGASFEHERDGDALEPEPLGQARPRSSRRARSRAASSPSR